MQANILNVICKQVVIAHFSQSKMVSSIAI